MKELPNENTHTEQTEDQPEFFDVHCPACGKLIGRYGYDLKGSIMAVCRKCKAKRLIQVSALGKLLIEFVLPGVYSPAENLGGNRKST